jgi:exopolysaccharide production protein ExoZ
MQTQPIKLPIYKTLDSWRGFAALWVVMVHSCVTEIEHHFPNLQNVGLYKFALMGQLGVVIFFVVSGYCIANAAFNTLYKSNSILYFFWARIRRIYPPYIFGVGLFMLLALAKYFLVTRGAMTSTSSADLVFLNREPAYYFSQLTLTQPLFNQKPFLFIAWSLCYEVAFYAIVGFILWISKVLQNPYFLFNSLNFLTLFTLGWLIISPENCIFPFNFYPQFGLGIIVYDFLLHRKHCRRPFLFLMASIALLLIYAMLYSFGEGFGKVSTREQSLFCILFTLLIIWLNQFDANLIKFKFMRVFAVVGIFSYSLHLTHLVPLTLIIRVSTAFKLSENFYWISFLSQILFAVVCAYFFYILFERPFMSSKQSVRALLTSSRRS